MQTKKNIKKGYTLVEVLVAIGIFATLMVMVSTTVVSYYQAQKKQKALNELYQEARFLTERIIREVRVNTIDFEEYFSIETQGATNYGENAQEYEKRFYFYYADKDSRNMHEGYFSTNANTLADDDDPTQKAIQTNKQDELYLISADGKTKTILKRIGNGIDDDFSGAIDDGGANDTGLESLAIAKMVVADMDGNGLNDSWVAHDDYMGTEVNETDCINGNSWIELGDNSHCLHFYSITPPLVKVEDLSFYVAPLEDPRKAFNEEGKDVQMQPHVTIALKASFNGKKALQLSGPNSTIFLQTTASSRVYNNVLFSEL